MLNDKHPYSITQQFLKYRLCLPIPYEVKIFATYLYSNSYLVIQHLTWKRTFGLLEFLKEFTTSLVTKSLWLFMYLESFLHPLSSCSNTGFSSLYKYFNDPVLSWFVKSCKIWFSFLTFMDSKVLCLLTLMKNY